MRITKLTKARNREVARVMLIHTNTLVDIATSRLLEIGVKAKREELHAMAVAIHSKINLLLLLVVADQEEEK